MKRAEMLKEAAEKSIGSKEGLRSARKELEILIKEYEMKEEYYAEIMEEIEASAEVRKEGNGYILYPRKNNDRVLLDNFISDKNGGEGAVREFVEYILKKDGKWEQFLEKVK